MMLESSWEWHLQNDRTETTEQTGEIHRRADGLLQKYYIAKNLSRSQHHRDPLTWTVCTKQRLIDSYIFAALLLERGNGVIQL